MRDFPHRDDARSEDLAVPPWPTQGDAPLSANVRPVQLVIGPEAVIAMARRQ